MILDTLKRHKFLFLHLIFWSIITSGTNQLAIVRILLVEHPIDNHESDHLASTPSVIEVVLRIVHKHRSV